MDLGSVVDLDEQAVMTVVGGLSDSNNLSAGSAGHLGLVSIFYNLSWNSARPLKDRGDC